MPRNVRNFWVELQVDGKAIRVETGPKARGGGFNLTILQRDKGGIVTAARISGRALSDGTIHLDVTAEKSDRGPVDFRVSTER